VASQQLRSRCLENLGRIYIETGQLPSSYRPTSTVEKLHDRPTILGSSADIWQGSCRGSMVAIKNLKFSHLCTDESMRKVNNTDSILHSEIKSKFQVVWDKVVIWSGLRHENIIPFLGISENPYPSVISNWMRHGDLTNYLRLSPEVDGSRLVSRQIVQSPRLIELNKSDLKRCSWSRVSPFPEHSTRGPDRGAFFQF
jgi:hypothetical protein